MKNDPISLARLFGRIATPIAVVFITIFSFAPSEDIDVANRLFFGDKGMHAIAYAVFSFCLCLAIALPVRLRGYRSLFLAIVTPLAWGCLIEVIQPLFLRSREAADLAADALGILAGVLLAAGASYYLERRIQKQHEQV